MPSVSYRVSKLVKQPEEAHPQYLKLPGLDHPRRPWMALWIGDLACDCSPQRGPTTGATIVWPRGLGLPVTEQDVRERLAHWHRESCLGTEPRCGSCRADPRPAPLTVVEV